MRVMLRRQVVSDKMHLAIVAILISGFLYLSIPTLRNEQNRRHQKRTMADMRSIATALEARATDLSAYGTGIKLTRISLNEVAGILTPRYLKTLPRMDGWGNEYEIRMSERSYVILSRGSDGRFDAEHYARRIIKSFRQDIVFGDGAFIQYPEGSCVE